MRTLFTPLFCVFSLLSFSQSAEWTKEDRNTVFDEYITALAKHKAITTDQKESIALCCLDEVTKKFTKKDYQAKIDIEIKRIAEANILQCSKNIGVDLTAKAPVLADTAKPVVAAVAKRIVNEGNFTRDDLVGVWRDNNSKIFFNADGSCIIKMDNGESAGFTYWVDEKKDIVIDNYSVLQVKSFDGKTLTYQQTMVTKKNIISKKKVEIATFTAVKMD